MIGIGLLLSSLILLGIALVIRYTGSTKEKEFEENTGARFTPIPENCIDCKGDCSICEEMN